MGVHPPPPAGLAVAAECPRHTLTATATVTVEVLRYDTNEAGQRNLDVVDNFYRDSGLSFVPEVPM